METFKSNGKDVPFQLFQPPGGGKHPAVVMAHGTDGIDPPWGKAFEAFAKDLQRNGYLVLIPQYFKATNSVAGLQDALPGFLVHDQTWVQALSDAVSFAASRDDVEADKIGLLGFSMGGHLVLRAAKTRTGVQVGAVVVFFTPITSPPPFNGIGADIDRLPPLQIHHGDADQTVRIEQSLVLERLLAKAGKREGTDYTKHTYRGEDHGFHGFQGQPAVNDSMQHTREFFDQLLK
jgi:dienelactone hydrolase